MVSVHGKLAVRGSKNDISSMPQIHPEQEHLLRLMVRDVTPANRESSGFFLPIPKA